MPLEWCAENDVKNLGSIPYLHIIHSAGSIPYLHIIHSAGSPTYNYEEPEPDPAC